MGTAKYQHEEQQQFDGNFADQDQEREQYFEEGVVGRQPGRELPMTFEQQPEDFEGGLDMAHILGQDTGHGAGRGRGGIEDVDDTLGARTN